MEGFGADLAPEKQTSKDFVAVRKELREDLNMEDIQNNAEESFSNKIHKGLAADNIQQRQKECNYLKINNNYNCNNDDEKLDKLRQLQIAIEKAEIIIDKCKDSKKDKRKNQLIKTLTTLKKGWCQQIRMQLSFTTALRSNSAKTRQHSHKI